jgi:predicted GIY-YIG superfamily endonuclease
VWYVYIIHSEAFPEEEYTGATANLRQRVADHNAGKSRHTAKFIPWKLVWYSAFPDKYRALEFERYLKSQLWKGFCEEEIDLPNKALMRV